MRKGDICNRSMQQQKIQTFLQCIPNALRRRHQKVREVKIKFSCGKEQPVPLQSRSKRCKAAECGAVPNHTD